MEMRNAVLHVLLRQGRLLRELRLPVECGGADGAIEHAHLVDGKLECKVIGGGRPTGICGSGLIDIIACLLDAGVIDESGKLLENPRVVQIDENTKKAYLLADPLESGDGKPVYLSQKDIREVQLAKGAIAAGIALLAEQMGITLEQVEQVYIAGAFGNYMDPAGACRIECFLVFLRIGSFRLEMQPVKVRSLHF